MRLIRSVRIGLSKKAGCFASCLFLYFFIYFAKPIKIPIFAPRGYVLVGR